MATFLDISGLSSFSSIFVFIFVGLAVYSLLMYSKVLGGNQLVYTLFSFIIALFVLLSPVATGVIAYIAPWLGIVFVFMIFISMILKSFGATGADTKTFAPLKVIFFVVIISVILIGALNYIRENTGISKTQEDLDDNFDATKSSNILLHPKIIGAIFVFLVAIFTVALMVGQNK